MKLTEALSKAQEYRERLHVDDMWSSPTALSEAMSKIAVYTTYIAENIAGLHKRASETEILAYKAARKRGMTATDSTTESKEKSLEARENYEHAKLVHKSFSGLTNIIQSRLKILTEQARGNQ